MQALRTIIWVALAVLVVVFAVFNWVPATVRFWPGMVLETKLPVIAIGAFLLGSLPLWLAHRLSKWRLSRQLDTSQRELDIYRMANAPPVPPPTPAEPVFGAGERSDVHAETPSEAADPDAKRDA